MAVMMGGASCRGVRNRSQDLARGLALSTKGRGEKIKEDFSGRDSEVECVNWGGFGDQGIEGKGWSLGEGGGIEYPYLPPCLLTSLSIFFPLNENILSGRLIPLSSRERNYTRNNRCIIRDRAASPTGSDKIFEDTLGQVQESKKCRDLEIICANLKLDS